MADRPQEESPANTRENTRRLHCSENREYTNALLLLASVAIAALVVSKQWALLGGIVAGAVVPRIVLSLWRRWRLGDPIRRMDANLPKISFDKEAEH